jgi:hypothetical protein
LETTETQSEREAEAEDWAEEFITRTFGRVGWGGGCRLGGERRVVYTVLRER